MEKINQILTGIGKIALCVALMPLFFIYCWPELKKDFWKAYNDAKERRNRREKQL